MRSILGRTRVIHFMQLKDKDDSFSDAGKVGVWTKADSETLLDDLGFSAK